MPRRTKSRKPMSEINVVPYIDVMLVLLVIFMITVPLLTEGVKVELPQAEANPIEEEAKRPFVVTVQADGRLSVVYDDDRKREDLDRQTLFELAAAYLRVNPNDPVLVKGDRNVSYEKVVEAMVILQRAGAKRLGLLTQPPEEPKRKR